jgi:hypothetical protein
MTLFAVTLGGRAPKANTELHDVVFVVGDRVEDTYEQLLDKWFGTPEGLHLDSWMALDVVDGYRVTLSPTPDTGEAKLFFVNLGAYRDGEFAELHANLFVVVQSAPAAKARAKSALQKTGVRTVHKDYLYDVDDCIALNAFGALHVVLTKTGETSILKPHSDYHVIPKKVIAGYVTRKR